MALFTIVCLGKPADMRASIQSFAMRLAAAASTLLAAVAAVDTTVDLGYSRYKGIAQANGVSQWLGIRFAAPPVGDLRFAPPQDPKHTTGVQPADKVRQSMPRCFMSLTPPPVRSSVPGHRRRPQRQGHV